MVTKTKRASKAVVPDPKFVHGMDPGIVPASVAAQAENTTHANLLSSTTTTQTVATKNTPRRYHVIQSGIIKNTTTEEVRSVFLNPNVMWKWHWQIESVEVLHEGDHHNKKDSNEGTPKEDLPTPLNYEQKVFFYQTDAKEEENTKKRRASTRPIVQKVVAATPNSVTLYVKSRPPVRRVHVTLSMEKHVDGIKVIVDFSYQLGWFFQILVSLGIVNVSHEVRDNLKKDIAALRHYMETKEVTTNQTELNVDNDDDE
mmetsp:Transcript_14039/g.26921  ORF Transcript_14039/g.26921 Transcript_14039/m.26921 type:complete len:257 (+) Transcript_14039:124-894(+)